MIGAVIGEWKSPSLCDEEEEDEEKVKILLQLLLFINPDLTSKFHYMLEPPHASDNTFATSTTPLFLPRF